MATITWTGAAGDGNFSNPNNWSPKQVPGAADTAVITPTAATAIALGNITLEALTTSKVVTLNLADNTSLTIGSGTAATTFSNAGVLNINSGGDGTSLIVGSSKLTLSGGGSVVMSNNGGNRISAASAGDTLNNVNNTISGAGQLGAGTLTLVNGTAGVINANDSNAMVLNTGAGLTTNSGLIEATSTGGLTINSTVNNGTAGRIVAAGGGVFLQGGTLQGGTLSSSGGAVISVANGTFDGTANTVTNTGTVVIDDNNSLTVLGTITNIGTIDVASGGDGTYLAVGPTGKTPGTVTLTGSGHVVMADNGSSIIEGNIAGDTLINLNNTISGAGRLGNGQLTFVNDATVNATGVNSLVVNTGSVVTNNSLMEATGTGGLVIQSEVSDTAGGTILAAGGNVYLQSTIDGGVLNSTGKSEIVTQNATLNGATQAVTNTGSVAVQDNTTLGLDGSIVNHGVIALQSSGDATNLVANSATVTLSGSGTVVMSDNGGNRIYGASSATVFDNVNNLIEGSGQIGASSLTFDNSGTVDATGTASALYLNGDALITNTGLLEATGSAGLYVQGTTIDSNGGTMLASGGNFIVQNSTLAGGTLNTSGSSLVVVQNSNLDGTANAVTNDGQVQVTDNYSLGISGTINNAGTITLASSGDDTNLIIDTATVTLTGGGEILLSDSGTNRIYSNAAGDTLVNVNNTIAGAGQLGVGGLTLTNEAGGTIDATGTNALVVNTGSGAFSNLGLLEATGTGGLTINSTVVNGNIIEANGGNVSLINGDIQGGTLATAKGGMFYVSNGTLDGSAANVVNNATVVVDDNTNLSLLGTITNNGTISLASSGDQTNLVATSPTLTLNGGGTIVLSNNGQNRIYGSSGSTVINNVNNTIEGAGQLGAAQVEFINELHGVIDANDSNALYINADSFTNDGLVEATGTGGLVIQSTIVNNATISAAGGVVSLTSTIEGGTIASSLGGSFSVSGGVLDGMTNGTLTSNASVVFNDNTNNYLLGTIVNDGTLTVNSTGDQTNLIADSATLTLTGGGKITLSDNGQNRIYGAGGGTVIDNINNTIAGAGQFGAGQLTYINGSAAIVDAAGVNNALYVNCDSFTNNGLLEATGAGGMVIQSVINNGSVGRIEAIGGNISVNGGTIAGGTLTSSAGNAFYVTNGELDGSTNAIVNQASIFFTDNTNNYLLGTIDNTGTITENSSGDQTNLIINSAELQLTGNGTLVLSDNGQNRFYGASASDILDNVGNTIEGAGQLGVGQLTLINNGIIEATGGNALIVSLGSTGTNTVNGQLLGIGSGGLVLENGIYTNSGLIEARNGSSVTMSNGATLTNSAGGTLTGGTYGAISTGNGASLTLAGNAITTLNADMLLSGAGSEISAGGSTIEASLKTISRAGELQVLGDRAYDTKNRLSIYGTLALGGGLFTAAGVTTKTTGLVSGFGTLAAKLTSGGTLQATGGTLELTGAADTISGAVSGTGTLEFGHGTATFDTGASLSVSAIAVIGGANLVLDTALSFAGVLDIVGKSTISGTGTFTNNGVFEQTGTGLASVGAPFSNVGTIAVDAGGTLAFSGGLANTGAILDNGVFTDTAALTGGSLAVGAKGSSATIASVAGAGNSTISTLTVGGGTLNTSGTTLTVTGDYNNTAAGVGNSYNPFAGVTGTIDGKGTGLAVVGVDGTTITTVNGTMTITVAPGGTANFVIENTGAAGSAALRGALETTVNGGNITGHALSGSGVTAQNFGAIAAGGESGVFSIAYSKGTLAGEAIHLASDFANVAGLTIDIVAGTAGASAPPGGMGGAHPDYSPQLLGWEMHHAW